jgi:hypothetical protein
VRSIDIGLYSTNLTRWFFGHLPKDEMPIYIQGGKAGDFLWITSGDEGDFDGLCE